MWVKPIEMEKNRHFEKNHKTSSLRSQIINLSLEMERTHPNWCFQTLSCFEIEKNFDSKIKILIFFFQSRNYGGKSVYFRAVFKQNYLNRLCFDAIIIGVPYPMLMLMLVKCGSYPILGVKKSWFFEVKFFHSKLFKNEWSFLGGISKMLYSLKYASNHVHVNWSPQTKR